MTLTHTDIRVLGVGLLILGFTLSISFGLATVVDWYCDLVTKAMKKAMKKHEQSSLDT